MTRFTRSSEAGRAELRDRRSAERYGSPPRSLARNPSEPYELVPPVLRYRLCVGVEDRERMGAAFVDYLLAIKDAELARFNAEVTDWEHREYFEMY